MGKLSRKYQVAFWSSPEVRVVLDRLVSEAVHKVGISIKDGKIRQQHLLNALILYVGGLDEEARRQAIAEGVAQLEAILDDPPENEGGEKFARPVRSRRRDRIAQPEGQDEGTKCIRLPG